MFVIRKEQIEVFRKEALRQFEDEMVTYSKDFAPEFSKVLTDEKLRLIVRAAIKRANNYGFTNRGPIRLFVELIFLLGSAFDTDPQYPWASSILCDSSDEMERAELLYEKIIDYHEKVLGKDDTEGAKSLRKFLFRLRQSPSVSEGDFFPAVLREIEYAFPQKAAYVGNSGLHTLIQKSCAVAQAAGFSAFHPNALIAGLLFVLGHGCADDPLYPWIANTLYDKGNLDPAKRTDLLHLEAVTWLDSVIAGNPGEKQA